MTTILKSSNINGSLNDKLNELLYHLSLPNVNKDLQDIFRYISKLICTHQGTTWVSVQTHIEM